MNFSPEQVAAMRTLARIWSAERFVLIGASALGCFIEMSWRQTRDLDLALAVRLSEYPAGIEKEPGWSRHPTLEQRWIAPGAVYFDIIPVGGNQPNPPLLIWPKSGLQMSLLGMRLAFELDVRVEAAPGLGIRVAPLEVLALLKMVGYLDRPSERERDLEDIAHILNDYVADADERRYAEGILDLGLGYEEVSPFLLGKRLTAIVNVGEREAVQRFTDRVRRTDDPTSTQARMLLHAPPGWRRNSEELLMRIAAFERGFVEDVNLS